MNLFDLQEMKKKIDKLEEDMVKPNFWEDSKNSAKVLQESKSLKRIYKAYETLSNNLQNLVEMNELLVLEQDDEMEIELVKDTKNLQKEIEKLEIETMLNGKYDRNNAIITLHPGAGGTESQDWAEMLYRMYCRWANSNGYSIQELDYLEGEEAGLKSVTFLISGENAYGYLKSEIGVHRLVRISPFDAGGRRHTSFASVEVLPEITEDVDIQINQEELRIDTYRASRSWWTTY